MMVSPLASKRAKAAGEAHEEEGLLVLMTTSAGGTGCELPTPDARSSVSPLPGAVKMKMKMKIEGGEVMPALSGAAGAVRCVWRRRGVQQFGRSSSFSHLCLPFCERYK